MRTAASHRLRLVASNFGDVCILAQFSLKSEHLAKTLRNFGAINFFVSIAIKYLHRLLRLRIQKRPLCDVRPLRNALQELPVLVGCHDLL